MVHITSVIPKEEKEFFIVDVSTDTAISIQFSIDCVEKIDEGSVSQVFYGSEYNNEHNSEHPRGLKILQFRDRSYSVLVLYKQNPSKNLYKQNTNKNLISVQVGFEEVDKIAEDYKNFLLKFWGIDSSIGGDSKVDIYDRLYCKN
jgi:hypothetical protein